MNSNWKLSSSEPALVVSSGQLFIGNRKPKGLTLEMVLEIINKNPTTGYYSKKTTRIRTLGETMAGGNFNELGKKIEVYASIDLYLQRHDRIFPTVPVNGRQLLNSKYKSKPQEIKDVRDKR